MTYPITFILGEFLLRPQQRFDAKEEKSTKLGRQITKFSNNYGNFLIGVDAVLAITCLVVAILGLTLAHQIPAGASYALLSVSSTIAGLWIIGMPIAWCCILKDVQ
jgi:hypothetical protein